MPEVMRSWDSCFEWTSLPRVLMGCWLRPARLEVSRVTDRSEEPRSARLRTDAARAEARRVDVGDVVRRRLLALFTPSRANSIAVMVGSLNIRVITDLLRYTRCALEPLVPSSSDLNRKDAPTLSGPGGSEGVVRPSVNVIHSVVRGPIGAGSKDLSLSAHIWLGCPPPSGEERGTYGSYGLKIGSRLADRGS